MADRPWIIIREGRPPRWGGELRRGAIFERLAERTHARVVDGGWSPRLLRRAARGTILGTLPTGVLARLPVTGPRPLFASSEKLRDRLLDVAIALTDPSAVAIYDDPVAQARALGLASDEAWLAELARRQQRNAAAFRWLVVPTASFAELAGLDPGRVIVGGNGTDTRRIVARPFPEALAIGVVSGAAPGRGLELLVSAVDLARSAVPGLVLRMWLVATGQEGEGYLQRFRSENAVRPWVEIGSVAPADLSDALATASILAIPHPPNAYMDVALPVKLFDSMAAGRPLVVTPRTETAAVVRSHEAGLVAAGDRVEDVAEAFVALLGDPARLHQLGARARAAAVGTFDWRIVGDRIADRILELEAIPAGS